MLYLLEKLKFKHRGKFDLFTKKIKNRVKFPTQKFCYS